MVPPPTALDANIVVSAVLVGHPAAFPRRILRDLLASEGRYIASIALLREYLRALCGPRILMLSGLSVGDAEVLVAAIQQRCLIVEAPAGRELAPNQKDQHLWDLLEAVPGSILVTGDGPLVRAGRRGTVISPREFSELYLATS